MPTAAHGGHHTQRARHLDQRARRLVQRARRGALGGGRHRRPGAAGAAQHTRVPRPVQRLRPAAQPERRRHHDAGEQRPWVCPLPLSALSFCTALVEALPCPCRCLPHPCRATWWCGRRDERRRPGRRPLCAAWLRLHAVCCCNCWRGRDSHQEMSTEEAGAGRLWYKCRASQAGRQQRRGAGGRGRCAGLHTARPPAPRRGDLGPCGAPSPAAPYWRSVRRMASARRRAVGR